MPAFNILQIKPINNINLSVLLANWNFYYSKIDNLVADFLKYSKSRVIASDFSISDSEVSYLVNEI